MTLDKQKIYKPSIKLASWVMLMKKLLIICLILLIIVLAGCKKAAEPAEKVGTQEAELKKPRPRAVSKGQITFNIEGSEATINSMPAQNTEVKK